MASLADILSSAIDPFSYERAQQLQFNRNRPWSQPGPYETRLPPGQEQDFRNWVGFHRVPFNPDNPNPQDYDMRGFFRGLELGDPNATTGIDPNDNRLHFSDRWKTPYHESFSRESRYAGLNAPRWVGDQLIAPDGTVVFDDRRQR